VDPDVVRTTSWHIGSSSQGALTPVKRDVHREMVAYAEAVKEQLKEQLKEKTELLAKPGGAPTRHLPR